MRWEIFKGKNGQYYFRLKAANGEIVAQSEGYKQKQSAVNTIYSIEDTFADTFTLDIIDKSEGKNI